MDPMQDAPSSWDANRKTSSVYELIIVRDIHHEHLDLNNYTVPNNPPVNVSEFDAGDARFDVLGKAALNLLDLIRTRTGLDETRNIILVGLGSGGTVLKLALILAMRSGEVPRIAPSIIGLLFVKTRHRIGSSWSNPTDDISELLSAQTRSLSPDQVNVINYEFHGLIKDGKPKVVNYLGFQETLDDYVTLIYTTGVGSELVYGKFKESQETSSVITRGIQYMMKGLSETTTTVPNSNIMRSGYAWVLRGARLPLWHDIRFALITSRLFTSSNASVISSGVVLVVWSATSLIFEDRIKASFGNEFGLFTILFPLGSCLFYMTAFFSITVRSLNVLQLSVGMAIFSITAVAYTIFRHDVKSTLITAFPLATTLSILGPRLLRAVSKGSFRSRSHRVERSRYPQLTSSDAVRPIDQSTRGYALNPASRSHLDWGDTRDLISARWDHGDEDADGV